jgi:alpha-beta hydrolase superfamily lysophospholipase
MKYLYTHSDDGTKLRLARWNEEGSRDILLIHGLAEHLGRYQHIGSFFAEKGWRVTALELRGHGESGGKRGHTDRWHRYFEDVQAAMGTIQKPVALVGHSMGGLITLWSLRYPITPEVRCIALSNPLLGLFQQPPRLKVMFGKIAERVIPKLSIPNGINPDFISRDPEEVQQYKNDPLIYGTITTRWGNEMLNAVDDVHEYAPQYKYPLRLMIGEADKICDPAKAKQFATAYTGSIDTVCYEKCYHELFNEPEKMEILKETEHWLDQNF